MRVREGRSQAIQSAIRKYGAEGFSVKTLVVADDWEYLCDLERKAIVAYGTRAPGGYNLTAGGEGTVDRVHTELAAANMSAGQKRRQQRPEERRRLLEVGEKAREVSRKKWADLRIDGRAKWQRDKRDSQVREGSPEHRRLMSESTRAAMARPEVAAKVKAAAVARAADPAWRAKLSVAKKGQGLGRKLSPEQKAKMAEARRRWWANKKAKEAA